MRKMMMIFALLSLPACAAKQAIIMTPPARCADLVPTTWAQGVPATPVPDTAAPEGVTGVAAAIVAVKAWAAAYLGMSGQLEKANGRTADAIGIVRQCEAQTNAARSATPGKH